MSSAAEIHSFARRGLFFPNKRFEKSKQCVAEEDKKEIDLIQTKGSILIDYSKMQIYNTKRHQTSITKRLRTVVRWVSIKSSYASSDTGIGFSTA